MPAISSATLDCIAQSPAEAVVRFFAHTQDLRGEGTRALRAQDVLVKASTAGVDTQVDAAWSWRLTADAPTQRDFAGTAFIRVEGGDGELRMAAPAERPALLRGVVGYRDDYGGYMVCVDGGEDDDDENLMEYGIAGLCLDD